jgi:phenylalanine-4-hydroxylase
MAALIAPSRFELPPDHPGVSDPAYRARRAQIAEVGAAYHRGDPIPDVTYTAEEDEVWRTVSTELAGKHRRYACREYLCGADRLVLPTARVPQLREVDERVHRLTGFHINPVPGLVPARRFYGSLAERTFLSTQYIRHYSVPFYTPEPARGSLISTKRPGGPRCAPRPTPHSTPSAGSSGSLSSSAWSTRTVR